VTKIPRHVAHRVRPKAIQEFWTVFQYGDALTLCSRHRTPEAAERAAIRCERVGGSRHRLLYVEELGRRSDL